MSSSDWASSAGDRRVPVGYRWIRTIRQGPWGTVQLAHDEMANRPVVVELLVPVAPDQAARIAHDSALATSLGHPHILRVLATGELPGSVYLITPVVDGPELGTRLAAGPLPWQATLNVLAPVADALDTAHRAGLVHRGVGPSAILLAAPSELPVLRGFGVAGGGFSRPGELADDLAPEQILGGPIGPHTDVYALGSLLYRCLTGRAPFLRADPAAAAAAQVNEPPPRVTELRPDLPWAIDGVVATAMAKDPARRFAGGRALVDAAAVALGAGRITYPTAAPRRIRRGPVLIALGVVVALVAAAVFALPPIIAAFGPAAADLDRVPAALRVDCDKAAAEAGLPGAARVLRCRDGSGQEVNVSLFGSDLVAESTYRELAKAATGAKAGDGDCAEGPGWEHRYPGLGAPQGRVFCDRDAAAVRMAWLDQPSRSVAVAVRPDGNAKELYRLWSDWVQLAVYPTDPERQLLDTLPETDCRRAKAGGLENLDGLLAAVTCVPIGTGASTVTYYRFADADKLGRAYGSDVKAAGTPPTQFCADRSKPEITTGNTRFVKGPIKIGQVLCGNAAGAPAITWTAEPLLTMGRAVGVERAALAIWWDVNQGPKTQAIVAATNLAASPPFPNAQEDALLKRLPPAIRPLCQRPSAQTLTEFSAAAAVAAVECAPERGPARAYYFQFADATAVATTITKEVTGPDCTTSPPDFTGIARYQRTNGSTGTLLCFQNDKEAGIGWIDEQANIYASAFGANGGALITWWQNEADPM